MSGIALNVSNQPTQGQRKKKKRESKKSRTARHAEMAILHNEPPLGTCPGDEQADGYSSGPPDMCSSSDSDDIAGDACRSVEYDPCSSEEEDNPCDWASVQSARGRSRQTKIVTSSATPKLGSAEHFKIGDDFEVDSFSFKHMFEEAEHDLARIFEDALDKDNSHLCLCPLDRESEPPRKSTTKSGDSDRAFSGTPAL